MSLNTAACWRHRNVCVCVWSKKKKKKVGKKAEARTHLYSKLTLHQSLLTMPGPTWGQFNKKNETRRCCHAWIASIFFFCSLNYVCIRTTHSFFFHLLYTKRRSTVKWHVHEYIYVGKPPSLSVTVRQYNKTSWVKFIINTALRFFSSSSSSSFFSSSFFCLWWSYFCSGFFSLLCWTVTGTRRQVGVSLFFFFCFF